MLLQLLPKGFIRIDPALLKIPFPAGANVDKTSGANKLAPANLVLPCPSSYAPKPKAALGEDNIFNNPLPALP